MRLWPMAAQLRGQCAHSSSMPYTSRVCHYFHVIASTLHHQGPRIKKCITFQMGAIKCFWPLIPDKDTNRSYSYPPALGKKCLLPENVNSCHRKMLRSFLCQAYLYESLGIFGFIHVPMCSCFLWSWETGQTCPQSYFTIFTGTNFLPCRKLISWFSILTMQYAIFIHV